MLTFLAILILSIPGFLALGAIGKFLCGSGPSDDERIREAVREQHRRKAELEKEASRARKQ